MSKMRGGCTPMTPLNPKANSSSGGEYQADMMQKTYRSVHPAKASTHGKAMIDGPYGGKKPVS